jgi:hypothetical protein
MEIDMSEDNYIFPWGIYVGDLIENNSSIPLCLDSKRGGFCILFDEDSEEVTNNFIENVALKLFEVMPVGSIEVDIFDFGRPRFMKLSALRKANLYRVLYSKNRANDRFDMLDELGKDRLHNLLSFDAPTLSEYNKLNSEREIFHLLLINLDDFPDEMSSPKRIRNFLDASYDAGFYTIAFGSKKIVNSKSKATKAILKRFDTIKIEHGQFKISNKLFAFKELLNEYEFEYINDNKNQIVKQILSQWKSKQENSSEYDFLSIPIGAIGREKIYFTMGLKSQNYHAFIAGMTGMGKTNLLNSIIVGIAQNYTVKEIELYLMDYKPAGAEFIIFKNHPNCKKLFLESQDPTPAFEMLKEFQNEMYRRGGILNGKSIDEYNRENPNSILSRKILIIDEVQRMFNGGWKESNSFNNLVEDIVKAGRSYGLYLILTTQSLKEINMKDSIMGQIPLKISFRLNDSIEAMKVFKENQEASKKVVKLQKYQFVYSDCNQTIVAKADYLEKDRIEKILADIRSQRLLDEVVTPILIEKSSTKENRDGLEEKKVNKEKFTPKYSTDSAKKIMEQSAKRKREKGEGY